MRKRHGKLSLGLLGRRTALFLLIGLLSLASIFNIFRPDIAKAEQLSPRSVAISTSRAGATGVQYDFTISWGTATEVEGIIIQFCTTPLGTCTLPDSMAVVHGNVTLDAATGFPGSASFSEVTSNTGDCSDVASTMYCLTRTDTGSASGSGATIELGGITNPLISSGAFTTVYPRISLYNNATLLTAERVHDGTVAAGITQQLTTTGRVQERLQFCVAAIDDDDPLPADCSAFPTSTSIDIGVIDNSGVTIAPVEPTTTNGANDDYGVAMVNTNASGGVTIGYYPEAATNVSASDTDQLRNFRVLPTNCSATSTSLTDQCFINADTNGETFTAGTERFGLYVPCIDGSQGTTGANLGSVPAAYDGSDNATVEAVNCETEAATDFAWNNAGTVAPLASSTTVVDDEVVKLRFGATASATTPTGTYLVVTTYIATTTF